MQQLATIIRAQLETLVDQYDARLSNLPGYSSLPEARRRDLERRILNLIVQSLETSDYGMLVEYARQRADQWAARGLNLVWFQQALSVPEELLVPLIQSVETSNFVWQALNRSQSVVWQMMAERTQRAEERFRSIVETAHSGIMIINDEFHFVYANDQLTRISGYTQAELIGADFRQLLDEDSRQLVADRYVRRQRGEEVPADYEVAFIRKDGQKRALEMSAVLLRDTSGHTQTVAQVLDVTERKQAEAALARERNLLHTLIDSLPDQIFFKDTEGRVILNNMADARAMRVASPAEAIGKNVFDVFPVELAELYHADDMTVIHSGQAINNRVEPGIDEAGQVRWIQTTKVPLTDEQGKPIGLVGFAHDITQLKISELRVQELLKMREQQVRSSTEVSQEIAAAPDLNELFKRVVTLIKERFNYYHAQIFRYDPGRDAVVLVTGYGEVGQRLLADKHQLPMGRGVVGVAAATGESILAADMTHDKDWRPNPHLPETKGELAVPIKLRDQVLGVLDVQSDRAGALTGEDQLLLEGLCGQIAVAIESTRLIEQTQHSEQLMRTLIDAIPDYIYAKDTEGRFTLVNVAHAQLMGAPTPQDLIGKSDLDFYPRELSEQYMASEQPILRDGVPLINHEEPNLDDQGRTFWASTTKVPVRNQQGQIIGLVGITRDITERKQIEEALAQEQFLSSILMESVTDHIYFKDLQSRFIRISKSQSVRFGLSDPTQAKGKTDFDFFTEEHARLAYEDEQRIIQTGQPITQEERETWSDQPDSWVSTTKFPSRDETGNVVGTFGISHDITEHKLAEETINRERNLLRILIDNLPLYVYIKDRKSKFVINNRLHLGVMGAATQAEVIGKGDFDFFPQEAAAQYYADEQAVMQLDQPLINREETVIDRTTGQQQWVSSTKVPYHDERGNVIGFVGVTEDITERKQAELRLQELLEKVQQSEQLMRTLIDTLPDSIYAKDTESRFTLANLTEIRVGGATTFDELHGKNDFDRYPRELAERYFADEQPVLRDGIPLINREERGFDQAGNPRWQLSTKVPLRDSQGHIIGLVGTTRDITKSKLAEAERERLLLEQQTRALQLQTASEVSRAASSILKLDELLPQAVELIRARFGFYYVGIFLADDTSRWAVLRAGTGEAGQTMLTNAHQLEIGGASMIGQCIAHRQARVALDVGLEAIRFDNPWLPLTHSEMALPLTSRGRIIGAMTIQSDRAAAFTSDDVTVLQSMADQISNAVENARLYEQANTALHEVDAINRRLTGEAWETYLHHQAGQQVISVTDDSQTAPERLAQLDDLLAAGEITIEPAEDDQSEATVSAPILLRGQPIGALRMRTPLDSWDKDTEAILTGIAGHVAQAVENARLIEQTQRTASRERAINEINARVRQTIDLDAILRTAVNELGQSLKAARVTAHINVADSDQSSRRFADTGDQPQPGAAGGLRGNDHD